MGQQITEKIEGANTTKVTAKNYSEKINILGQKKN